VIGLGTDIPGYVNISNTLSSGGPRTTNITDKSTQFSWRTGSILSTTFSSDTAFEIDDDTNNPTLAATGIYSKTLNTLTPARHTITVYPKVAVQKNNALNKLKANINGWLADPRKPDASVKGIGISGQYKNYDGQDESVDDTTDIYYIHSAATAFVTTGNTGTSAAPNTFALSGWKSANDAAADWAVTANGATGGSTGVVLTYTYKGVVNTGLTTPVEYTVNLVPVTLIKVDFTDNANCKVLIDDGVTGSFNDEPVPFERANKDMQGMIGAISAATASYGVTFENVNKDPNFTTSILVREMSAAGVISDTVVAPSAGGNSSTGYTLSTLANGKSYHILVQVIDNRL